MKSVDRLKVYGRREDERLCTRGCCVRAFGDLACFVSLLLGLIVFTISTMTLFTHGEVTLAFGARLYYYGVYVLLFASLCTVVIALIGLSGLSSKNRFFIIILVLGFVLLAILLVVGIFFALFFPYPSIESMREAMLQNLKTSYGTFSMTTLAWDYLQSYLQCCAVDDKGWLAYRGSQWFDDENIMLHDDQNMIPESNPDFLMVPKTCCSRKLDYLTGYLTDEYENVAQCQNWQYGPPKFMNGAHNDAIYYRGCFPTLRAYIRRFSTLLAIFGASLLISMIITICLAIDSLRIVR